MTASIHWIGVKGLPEHELLIAAVPGVGNVGKLVVDTLNEEHDATLIARIIHPDLPPHSVLEDGFLTPPHLAIHSVNLSNSQTVITITGTGQPMTPRGQHETADFILNLASEFSTPFTVVMAGLSANPGDEQIHLAAPSDHSKGALEQRGITVSNEQPSGGMLGLAGLIVSLSSLHGVNAAAYCAETVGTSVDVVTADRLAQRLSLDFALDIDLPIDNTREMAARLLSMMEGKEIAGIDLNEDDSGSGFYV